MSDELDGQGDLFEPETLRDEAIARVEAHAHAQWMKAAKRIVWQLAQTREPFTTDIVWSRLEQLGVSTHEPRAMGAVMLAAVRAGFIAAQGYVKTTRPEAHCRPIPVYVGTAKAVQAA